MEMNRGSGETQGAWSRSTSADGHRPGSETPSRKARRGIPILMYHHIADAPPRGSASRYLFVTPSSFQRQMHALKAFGYVGCSLAELAPYLRGEKTGKVVGITFDDGFRNIHRHALPVLSDCGFTSTNYFVSRQIGGYNGWDKGRIRREPCMDKQQLREWSEAGQEVGGHTLDHPRLTDLAVDEARRQIARCKWELEDMVGSAVEAFSYPFGSHDETIARLVEEAGYTTATTTIRQRARSSTSPFHLPRLTVKYGDLLVRFLWKTMG